MLCFKIYFLDERMRRTLNRGDLLRPTDPNQNPLFLTFQLGIGLLPIRCCNNGRAADRILRRTVWEVKYAPFEQSGPHTIEKGKHQH